MSSFTTLVNTDADAAQKLASHVAMLLPTEQSEHFMSQCNTLIDAVKANELVMKFLEHSGVIFNAGTDDEVQGLFEAIFSVIYTLGETSQESVPATREIVRHITSNTTEHTERRLTVLLVLFNLIFSIESKLEVLAAIFKYASDVNQLHAVAHFHTYIPTFLTAWHLTAEQQRSLLRSVTSVLEKDGHFAEVVLKLNIRYFQTFRDSANTAITADVDNFMKHTVLQAINSPVDAFGDRAALLEAFHGLKVGSWSALLGLLKILCDGSLEEFLAFKTQHAALMKEHQLSEAVLEHKVKLLALCSLGNQGQKPVSFQTIQQALKLTSSEEVELWLIEAISSELISGSIDQLNATVTINRYAHRSFGPAQWKALQQKLRELRKSISVVQDNLLPNPAKLTV